MPGLDRAAAALETQQLDVVVIACRGFSDRAVFLVDRAVRLEPDRPVIILADGSPAGFVRRIFELGAEDILPLPQSPEQVRFAIHKTVQRRLGTNAASGQRQRADRRRARAEGWHRQDADVDEPRGRARAAGAAR